MATLSLCVNNNSNTGGIDCDVSRGVLKTLYIFNGSFSSGQYATDAAFTAAMIANAKLSKNNNNKIFPLPVPQEIADKSDANKEATFALGFKSIQLEGRPAYEFQCFAGSVQAKALRRFNNKTIRVLELDENNNVWGTKVGTTLKGFQAKLFVSGDKIGTGASGKPEEGVVTITVSFISNAEYKDSAVYSSVTASEVDDITGLIDCYMEQFSHVAGNEMHKVGVYVNTTKIGERISVSGQFGATLATAANFTAASGATLASPFTTSLAITSIAYDSTNKVMQVTFNVTAYGLLADASYIKLMPVAPQTLDAANVTGIEIDPVYLVVEQ